MILPQFLRVSDRQGAEGREEGRAVRGGLESSLGLRHSAQDLPLIMQLSELFSGYPCAIAIVDDITVKGCDVAEHDANLKKMLDRAREINLRLNPLKYKFRLD